MKPKLSRSLEVTGQVLTGATFAVLFGLWGSTAGAREAKASVKPRPASCDSRCEPQGGRVLATAKAYGNTSGGPAVQSGKKLINKKTSSPPKSTARKPDAPPKKDDDEGRKDKDNDKRDDEDKDDRDRSREDHRGDNRDRSDDRDRDDDDHGDDRDRDDDDEGDRDRSDDRGRGDDERGEDRDRDDDDEGDRGEGDKPDKGDEGDENNEPNKGDKPEKADEPDEPEPAVASPPEETPDVPPAAANDPANNPADRPTTPTIPTTPTTPTTPATPTTPTTPATPRASAPISDRLASGLRAASHTQPPSRTLSVESRVVAASTLPDQELTGAEIPTTRLPNGSELSNLDGTYYLNGVPLPADLGTRSPSSLAIDFDHWLARWAGNIQWQDLQGRADAPEILLGLYCRDQGDACGPTLKNSLTAQPPPGLILREMGFGAVYNALKRLAGHGPKVPPLSELAKSGAIEKVGDFGGYQLLLEHFSKHAKGVVFKNGKSVAKKGGADMPEFTKPSEYLAAAREFMGSAKTSDRVLESVRVNHDGSVDIIRVDPVTGYFGIRDTANGRVKTFFRPGGDPVAYFNKVIKP